jgi:hypothetical protein
MEIDPKGCQQACSALALTNPYCLLLSTFGPVTNLMTLSPSRFGITSSHIAEVEVGVSVQLRTKAKRDDVIKY